MGHPGLDIGIGVVVTNEKGIQIFQAYRFFRFSRLEALRFTIATSDNNRGPREPCKDQKMIDMGSRTRMHVGIQRRQLLMQPKAFFGHTCRKKRNVRHLSMFFSKDNVIGLRFGFAHSPLARSIPLIINITRAFLV